MAAVPTIDAIWARQAVAFLEESGRPADAILAVAGIDRRILQHEGSRITFQQHAALLDQAAAATGDDCFGLTLASQPIDLRDVGLLAYVGLSSRTLGDGVRNLVRYAAVLNEGVRITLDVGQSQAIIELQLIDPTVRDRRQVTEFAIANFVRAQRFLTLRHLSPAAVTFVHPRIDKIEAFERFFGCTVSFQQARYAVCLAPSQLAIPITTADDRLLRVLTSYCQTILADRKQSSSDLRHEIERVLLDLLPRGGADAQSVARALGMSVRTLSRRLKAEGAAFNTIRDRLRADLARSYLADGRLSRGQIAYLLGYAQISSLSHAAKRWTAQVPSLGA
jgi:AraC-like DNA-binding protein